MLPSPCSPPFPYTTLFRSRFTISSALASTHPFKMAWATSSRSNGSLWMDGSFSKKKISSSIHKDPFDRLLVAQDRKSTRLNSSHSSISYAVFCLKKKKYARSRHSSIQGGSPFFWEISRMTSSERPGGTVSDSISVTKPYLYGWRTWASIPLLFGAPEVLCASQVAEIWPWRKRILQELLGIVNQAPGCALVDVPIHLPDEALVILRRVEIIDDRRVVDR